MHPLDALFRPASVAIIGASSDANKVGGRPIAFLKKAGWRGRIFPVNPGAAEVQGLPAYASLAAIDGAIDQAIIAVPAARVLAVADECLERGVKVLQIFSAGFGQGLQAQGAQGALGAQAQLRERAARVGARILGPNSLGLFNAVDGYFGTFATALDGAWPKAGGVGVATQSGAFGSYFFGMAQQRGLGFSHFVATGNESDIDIAECIGFMVADSATRLIVTAMEGCRDGRKLADALRAARDAGKTVLAMKVGASEAGAAAAATHTGSLSGADRVFDAVLRDCGAHRAGSLQELVDAAYVATVGPAPAGRRLLVVTTSGGIGVLCADAASEHALELPPIPAAARTAIREIAPLADGANPVDTSAGILADLAAYARIAECALEGAGCDAVLCYLAHIARNPAHWAQLREPLLALRRRHANKTFAAVLLADAAISSELEAHGFAVFADPTQAVVALAALSAPPSGAAPAAPAAPAPRDASDLSAGPASPRERPLAGPLATETDAKRALSEQGLHFAPERFVRDADEAAAAARARGWPGVLKIVSPDIAHKTEAGGVRLDLRDEATLRAALPAMRERVLAHHPQARFEGFIVARQLSGGIEVLVGSQNDPVFGPTITVGAGGVLAELLDDVQVRLAPVNPAQALQMLEGTRVGRLLSGFRGAPAADTRALAAQIATLSEIAWSNRARVAGIDLNPMLALPEGAYALDALIATHPPGATG
jgi:acyl-CoA synthetase (NDP forming)